MTNLDNQNHGFCYIAPNYIIFTGDYCNQNQTDEIPANTNISDHIDTILPPQIIFQRLRGNSAEATIHLSNDTKSVDISINHEGRIDW
jgi:hypothetical protein